MEFDLINILISCFIKCSVCQHHVMSKSCTVYNVYFEFQQWPQSESSYAHGRPHEFYYLWRWYSISGAFGYSFGKSGTCP